MINNTKLFGFLLSMCRTQYENRIRYIIGQDRVTWRNIAYDSTPKGANVRYMFVVD